MHERNKDPDHYRKGMYELDRDKIILFTVQSVYSRRDSIVRQRGILSVRQNFQEGQVGKMYANHSRLGRFYYKREQSEET